MSSSSQTDFDDDMVAPTVDDTAEKAAKQKEKEEQAGEPFQTRSLNVANIICRRSSQKDRKPPEIPSQLRPLPPHPAGQINFEPKTN